MVSMFTASVLDVGSNCGTVKPKTIYCAVSAVSTQHLGVRQQIVVLE